MKKAKYIFVLSLILILVSCSNVEIEPTSSLQTDISYSRLYYTLSDVLNLFKYNGYSYYFKSKSNTAYNSYLFTINEIETLNITLLDDVESYLKDNSGFSKIIRTNDNYLINDEGDYLIHNLLIEDCNNRTLINAIKDDIGLYEESYTCKADDVCSIDEYLIYLEDEDYEILNVEDIDIGIKLHRIDGNTGTSEIIKPYRTIILDWFNDKDSGQAVIIQVDDRENYRGSPDAYILGDDYLMDINSLGAISNNLILMVDIHSDISGLKSNFIKLGFDKKS